MPGLMLTEEEFPAYRNMIGAKCFILALPSSISLKQKMFFDDDGGGGGSGNSMKVTAAEGGVGYARLIIQLFASFKKFPSVWMLDDNVRVVHKREKESDDDNRAKMCRFEDVMLQTEAILENKRKLNSSMDFNDEWAFCENDPPKLMRDEKAEWDEMFKKPKQTPTTIDEYCGTHRNYGVLGIHRGSAHYSYVVSVFYAPRGVPL